MEARATNPKPDYWLKAACWLAAGLAGAALAGWFTGIHPLVTLMPGGSPIVVNAAVTLLMLAAGLWGLASGRPRWGLVAGGGAILVAVVVGLQFTFDLFPGFDQLLWRHQWAADRALPGRMAPNSALAFGLLGAALLLASTRWRRHWAIHVLDGAVMALAALPLLGFLSLLVVGRGSLAYFGMALPTVSALLLLGVGLERCVRRATPEESLALVYMAAAFGMLASIAFVTIQSSRQLVEANRLVVVSYDMRSRLDRLVEAVARMESSARGYALTGTDVFRDRVRYHERVIELQLEGIAQWAGHAPEQLTRLRDLRALLAGKDEQVRELMRRRADDGVAAAAAYLSDQPIRESRALVDLAGAMQDTENRLLVERQIRLESVQEGTRMVQVIGGLLSVALLGIATTAARRERRARAAAEAAVQEVNEMQRAVLDGTVFSVIATDPNGLIKEFNAGAERMLGYTRGEMVGKRTPEVIHLGSEIVARAAELSAHYGEAIPPGFEAFVAPARRGHVDEREWTYVRKNGTRLPVLLSVTALRDRVGRITGFLGVAQDLSAQHQAVQAMRTSEDRLHQVLGQAECLVWEAVVELKPNDWDWRIVVHPSGLFDRLFGDTRGAGLWYDFDVPEQQEMNARAREAMVSGSAGYAQEFRLRRDGQVIWIRESVSIRPKGVNQYALVGVATDITRLHDTTASLEQSEQQFRNAFEYAGIGMALVGLDGRWLRVNRAVCEIVGYTEEAMLRKTFQDITHPDDLHADLAALADLVAGRVDHYQMEKRYLHATGRVVNVNLTVSAVRNAAGEAVHFISQIEDITEKKEFLANLAHARDEALAASRMKSEFLANMSHEIRTPMNGVIGMADLLMDTALSAEQRQMLRVIRGSGENLLTILNDILDFSKIEAGKLTIQPVDFNLPEQIEQAVALLGPRARERHLVLVTELAPDTPEGLHGDAGRIQQILVNLLGNAVKFTEKGGVRVVLATRPATRPNHHAFRIEVHDTGIGIAEKDGARLFQPFTQADGSTTRKYGGTGLGLAISQQLVDLMQGRIGFTSEPGHGSVFWFELELPIVALPAAVPSAPPVPAGRRALAADVLVAEDNAANQLVIRLLLEKLGLRCELVADGAKVLERLAARDFSAVLMDCQMPGIDGYEAARRIRAGRDGVRQPRVPIIALTAHAQASDRDRCLAAGMDDYLAKPVRLETLRAMLEQFGVLRPSSAPPVPAAATVPPPAGDVLDLRQLAQLRDLPGHDGGTLLTDVAGMALGEWPPEILELQQAVRDRSGAEVARIAHRLAGSAANVGAVRLRERLKQIEQAGRQADWPALKRLGPELDQEWNVVRDALEKLLEAR